MEKIVLVGNPNVGKSIFFNAFTGIYVEVSNFPGTTVDISQGKYKNYFIQDTPGIYGVSSFNDEERVARDVILSGDIIINVVDGLHLNRDLFLSQQLIDMGKKVILCVNMMDEVKKNNITIDTERLSHLLGVPVLTTTAVENASLMQIKERFLEAKCGKKIEKISAMAESYLSITHNFAEAVMMVEDDEYILKKYRQIPKNRRDEVYLLRRKYVDDIISKVVQLQENDKSVSAKIGNFLLSPVTGVPSLIVILMLMFAFLGYFVAQTLVGFTEKTLMQGYYGSFITNLVGSFIRPESITGRFLIGEFGLLTMVPIYSLGLLLPLVAGFYFMLSILEDSGYLPRIATLVDRGLTKIGLNGRAIIPFILGFGCVTVATVSTRLLGSKRERVIATALLGLTIPCSAQFGVIIGNISKLGVFYSMLYVFVIVLVFAVIGKILDKFMKGTSTNLLIDLPRMRIPQVKNVVQKTYMKTKHFLFEAVPIFALGAFIITFMSLTGILQNIIDILSPVVVGFLRLPEEATIAFIMGIVRRDFGAAGLNALSLTKEQVLVSMVTLTLFVPCIASIMMLFKERSKKDAAFIWVGSFVLAFLVGGILSNLLALFV